MISQGDAKKNPAVPDKKRKAGKTRKTLPYTNQINQAGNFPATFIFINFI